MVCRRCGMFEEAILKRVERNGPQECSSCVARPAKTIKTEFGICRPWQGDFDENDNPLDSKGRLYRPGLRLCGKSDCVAKAHIDDTVWSQERIEEIEAERVGISYRTGEKLTYKQILVKAIKEGINGRNRNPGGSNK